MSKKNETDAYGLQLLSQFQTQAPTCEFIERDDGYLDTGSEPGNYFREYADWGPVEQRAIQFAKGKILDVGCGAGRHALYLQQLGLDVTGIDASPGAVKVCRSRGLKRAVVRPVGKVGLFKPGTFDTVLMFGNNFGLIGGPRAAPRILRDLYRITVAEGRIIAGTRNPYKTSDPNHLSYHRLNRRRGRMPGQIRMRVRFAKAISPWFDYLLISPKEMKDLLEGTGWEIEELLGADRTNYFAVLRKQL
jgi:SAM-dependent methyltransferase